MTTEEKAGFGSEEYDFGSAARAKRGAPVSYEILEIGRDLPVGSSTMASCPFCLATHERKLAVTRYADGLGYVCYRASCGAKGAITDYRPPSPAEREEPPRKELTPREFSGVREIPHGYAKELMDRIGCRAHGYWGLWSSGPDTVYYHLRDFQGGSRGWTTRTRDKKINSGRLVDKPLYGFYSDCELTPLSMWFVEDPLSAIRLANADKSAVALCGTHASDGLLNELWDEYPKCKRVYVALDPGAEESARKIVTKCRFEYGLDAIQVILPDDIHRLDSRTFKVIMESYP